MPARRQPKSVKGVYLSLDNEIYERLKARAKKKGLSLQELIRVVVGEYLEKG